jgi:preprotein translocase SecE subunit
MAKNKIISYFVNSFHELNKVTWPTKNQAIRLTAIVLGFCLVMAIVIGVVDGLFRAGYTYLLTIS